MKKLAVVVAAMILAALLSPIVAVLFPFAIAAFVMSESD